MPLPGEMVDHVHGELVGDVRGALPLCDRHGDGSVPATLRARAPSDTSSGTPAEPARTSGRRR